ncbi:MAG TPA: SRPBCC family protein [Chitinophagales bacterium]|nr:SRPBCC family protein [Chitinophagales bacterium]
MKAVKIVLLVLVVLFGAWLIASALFPSHCHLERSTIINAPPQAVFDQVNNLKNWEKWSHWAEMEPDAKKTYEGPEAGAGSKYSWEGKKIGKGTLTIVESQASDSIKMELDFPGEGKAYSSFRFEPADGGTKVTWDFDSDVGFSQRLFMGLMLNKFLGVAFEKGLAKLKTVAESVPPPPALPEVEPEVVEFPSQTVITMRDTTTLEGIPGSLGTIFQKVMEYVTSKKIQTSGYPLAIWHVFDVATNKVILEAGIPVSGSPKPDAGMNLIKIKGKAVKVTYFGDYKEMSPTYQALREWMTKNNVAAAGPPWEVYVTDPMMEKDTSKWQTDIYFPI